MGSEELRTTKGVGTAILRVALSWGAKNGCEVFFRKSEIILGLILLMGDETQTIFSQIQYAGL
jgi:hypothetical protein